MCVNYIVFYFYYTWTSFFFIFGSNIYQTNKSGWNKCIFVQCGPNKIFKLVKDLLETDLTGEGFNECLSELISNGSVKHSAINSEACLALSRLWGGVLLGCVPRRELGGRASPSEVYPAGKLQWHHLWPLLQSWRGYEWFLRELWCARLVFRGLYCW